MSVPNHSNFSTCAAEMSTIYILNSFDICTDGAKAMVSKTAGALALIKSVASNCSSSHCILHTTNS